MRRYRGKQFDPEIADLFLSMDSLTWVEIRAAASVTPETPIYRAAGQIAQSADTDGHDDLSTSLSDPMMF